MSHYTKAIAECISLGLFVIIAGIYVSGCGSDSPSGPGDDRNENGVLGETWTVQTPSAIHGMDDICWAGSKIVIVGTSANLPVVSTDGVSWQTASGIFDAQNVRYHNGHIVAGEYHSLFHSLDGINWDTIYVVQGVDTLYVRTYSHGLFTDKDGFLAWAYDKTFQNLYLIKSTDGVSWSVVPDPSSMWMIRAIARAPGSVVELSMDGKIRHNGVFVDSINLRDVIYAGSRFVAVGASGSATSSDGKSWVEHPGPGMIGVGSIRAICL